MIWERFNRGKEKQHWYYAGIVKALASRRESFPFFRELEEEVKAVFGGQPLVR
jgi:hypothetical protein